MLLTTLVIISICAAVVVKLIFVCKSHLSQFEQSYELYCQHYEHYSKCTVRKKNAIYFAPYAPVDPKYCVTESLNGAFSQFIICSPRKLSNSGALRKGSYNFQMHKVQERVLSQRNYNEIYTLREIEHRKREHCEISVEQDSVQIYKDASLEVINAQQ